MRQKVLYEPIKKWLETKDFEVLITGSEHRMVIPVGDLVPRAYKIPDLVGVDKSNKVIIVEVEQNEKKFLDVLGRCILWKCTATFVYIACPETKCQKARILEKLGIGLLSVNEKKKEVKELIGILPKESSDLHKVYELHPLDSEKELQLSKQIRTLLGR